MEVKRLLLAVIIQFIVFASLFGQDSTKVKTMDFSGYITNMQSFMFDSIGNNWVNDNLLHNRLNFKWYPNQTINTGIEIRNRIFTGETLEYTPGFSDITGKDKGLYDLSFNLFDKKSILLNSEIDRLWFTFEKEKFKATIGRQRINWGRSLVWNPNDIFNNYSFFDFDYAEKPGTDALRLEYYTNNTSSGEIVISADSAQKISSAALYKLNLKGFDVQLMSGLIKERDYIVGAGWEGNIGSVAFRGEASYVRAKENFSDTTGLVIACVSADYMFSNQLMIQFEFLYNQQTSNSGADFYSFYNEPASVKNLSFTEYNFFLNLSYPVTPLLNLTLSGMYYPKISGMFVGPSVSYSLKDNLDFSFFLQTFSGKFPNPLTGNISRQNFTLAFLRLKYSF